MPALEQLRGLRVVAARAALDGARWSGDRTRTGSPVGDVTVLRLSPDEAFAIGAHRVDLDDDGAIVEEEVGFVGAWLDRAEIEPYAEWPLPTEGPALAQGSIAGVPAKVWLPADGDALLLTAAAYAHELEQRLGWRS